MASDERAERAKGAELTKEISPGTSCGLGERNEKVTLRLRRDPSIGAQPDSCRRIERVRNE